MIYIAPEVLRNKYTLSADLWSVGIIAYLLLTGRLPFAGEEGEEVSDLFIRKQTFQNRVRSVRAHCRPASIAPVMRWRVMHMCLSQGGVDHEGCHAPAQAVFRAVLYSDLDFESPPWDTLSADAKHFVQALLNREADQRPTALEALHFK